MNNDVALDASRACIEMAAHRDDRTFAIAAQIEQTSSDGRAKKRGFVDWYLDRSGLRVFHADPGTLDSGTAARCASGGASLFRTVLLRRYAAASVCYDPAYWEDVEWGIRARREGYHVMFAPASRVPSSASRKHVALFQRSRAVRDGGA